MSAIQTERLIRLVQRVYMKVPYYREKMNRAGVSPQEIRELKDIQKLPLMTKNDIRENYPDRLFAVSRDEIVRLHASSGTTGNSTLVGYTAGDIEMWNDCVARSLTMAGVRKDDTLQVSYGYGLFTGGLGIHYGAENLGVTVIPMSTQSTKKQIEMIRDFGSTAIACTPSYLIHLLEEMKKQGILDKVKLSTAICGGEPWSEEMRAAMEKISNIRAQDIYGLSEILGPGVAADCGEKNGLHINEDHFYPEILNPETLQPVEEGETGELVLTTLTKEGFPLIRYRTRDITSLDASPCSCGRTLARLSKIRGRSDDMLIIKGVNVYPSQIEEVLAESGDHYQSFQIVIDRVENMDTFDILLSGGHDFADREEADHNCQKMARGIRQSLGLNARIRYASEEEFHRNNGKLSKVVDQRMHRESQVSQ